MNDVTQRRKAWNEKQKELRKLLSSSDHVDRAITLFYRQHSALHSAKLTESPAGSFEDAVFQNLVDESARRIPSGREHSIVWCIWHMARIEDATMNVLVAGTPQVLECEGWQEKLKVLPRDTGNGMDAADVVRLSNAIDIAALRSYRLNVGRRTREVVAGLAQDHLQERIPAARLQRLLIEGAVLPSEQGLVDYWSRRTVAGLLLMPPTRHNMVHLNEALQLKKRLR